VMPAGAGPAARHGPDFPSPGSMLATAALSRLNQPNLSASRLCPGAHRDPPRRVTSGQGRPPRSRHRRRCGGGWRRSSPSFRKVDQNPPPANLCRYDAIWSAAPTPPSPLKQDCGGGSPR
jgi:hypothetical protein